jgi:serine/threonine protein kinase
VTKSGVKLLDFGLAKMGQSVKPLGDATATMALTGKNEIVATLFYMSPEQLHAQADGREIDARSDISPSAWCSTKCSLANVRWKDPRPQA